MASTKNRKREVKNAMVEILDLSLDLLWDGMDEEDGMDTHLGICACINLAGPKYLNYTYRGRYGARIEKEVNSLCNRIVSSLGNYACWVDDWLLREGHITQQQYNDKPLLQAYRKRWLEALRAEYLP